LRQNFGRAEKLEFDQCERLIYKFPRKDLKVSEFSVITEIDE